MKGNNYHYQLTLVLPPKIEGAEAYVEKVVTAFGGGVKALEKNHLGLKDLVYKIKDLEKGDFWVVELESEKPVQLKEINLFLNRENNIIRYLILNKK